MDVALRLLDEVISFNPSELPDLLTGLLFDRKKRQAVTGAQEVLCSRPHVHTFTTFK